MNTIVSYKGVFRLLSFSALAVLGNSISAVAQTVETTSSFQLTQSSETKASSSNVSPEFETITPSVSTQTPVKSTVPSFKPTAVASNLAVGKQDFSTIAQRESALRVVTPVPGSTATSSAAFSNSIPTNQPSVPSVAQTDKPSAHHVAQADINVSPGKATRGGPSYVGIAANVGLSGGSALGDGNFTIISKIGLTNTFSVRPSAVLGDNPVILVPLTYDFNLRSVEPFTEPLPISPYLGGGVAIKTGDSTDAAFLVSGGVDVPLTRRFTATAAINAAFFSDTDVGLLIGVGYNFRGL